MTVLCDWEIRARAEGSQMVVPFNPELLNPASLDVVLGDFLMIETMHQQELLRFDISGKTEDDPYKLLPGHFCLAETLELFNLGDDLCSTFLLKKLTRKRRL